MCIILMMIVMNMLMMIMMLMIRMMKVQVAAARDYELSLAMHVSWGRCCFRRFLIKIAAFQGALRCQRG